MRTVRGVIAVLATTALLVGCGGGSSAVPSTDPVPEGKCQPTEEDPTLGLAAINRDYRVAVWDTPGSGTPRVLEQLGDDPYSESYGGDMTVVESVAVSPLTCAVFVGACCEPVSGITYHDGNGDGEWETLTGHLPAISPDGELLSLVAYEQLVISAVAEPGTAMVTIELPSADTATMYRSQWINGDEIAVSGFTSEGAFVWIARMSDGTLREGFRITPDVRWESDKMWRVGLIGVDESANLVTQTLGSGSAAVIEYRYPDSFEVHKTDDAPQGSVSYVMRGRRSSMVSENGALTVWFGNGDPQVVDGAYVWAG